MSIFFCRRLFALTFLAALLSVALLFVPQHLVSAAGVNRQMNYQGKLLTNLGAAVPDGSYNIKFVLYDAAAGGNALWTAAGTTGVPTAVSVSVSGGLFSINLGDTGAGQNAFDFPWHQESLFLGITVGADAEMTPRKRLTAVPYAFTAENVQGQYASSSIATTGGNLFALNQNSSTAATGDRSVLFLQTSGTSNVFDYLIKGSNGSTVFTVNRVGSVTTTGELYVGGRVTLGGSVPSVVIFNDQIQGSLVANADNTYNLGASGGNRWANIYSVNGEFTTMTVSGNTVCQSDGTNCLSGTMTATSSNWFYDAPTDVVRNATSTTDVILGGVSTTTAPVYFQLDGTSVSSNRLIVGQNQNMDVVVGGTTSTALFNSNFQFSGNDLFVSGNIGSASSVYSGGSFVTGGTNFGAGTISNSIPFSLSANGQISFETIGSNAISLDPGGSGVGGSVTLGSSSIVTDSIVFNGRVGSHMYAYSNATYDIGAWGSAFNNIYASGTANVFSVNTAYATSTNLWFTSGIGSSLTIGGSAVCRADGVNCPTAAAATTSNWFYDVSTDVARNATATTDLVIGGISTTTAPVYLQLDGTSASSNRFMIGQGYNMDVVIGASTSSGMNSNFQLSGHDLYVEGNIGSASSVYSNGSFVAGAGVVTRYGAGSISTPIAGMTISAGGAALTLETITSGGIVIDPVIGGPMGNIALGGNAADTITVTAAVNSDIYTSANNTYDLGSGAASWKNIYASGTIAFGSASGTTLSVGGYAPCLSNGVNCLMGTATSTSWVYDPTSDVVRNATTTADIVIGGAGTSTAPMYFNLTGENASSNRFVVGQNQNMDVVIGSATSGSLFNSNFQFSGNDLYVEGNIGSATSVFATGGFVTANTNYSDGVITNNGTFTISPTGAIYMTTIGGIVPSISFDPGGTGGAGAINLGTSITPDQITFGGRVASHVLAYANATYNIGAVGNAFNNVYASGTMYTTDIIAMDNSPINQGGAGVFLKAVTLNSDVAGVMGIATSTVVSPADIPLIDDITFSNGAIYSAGGFFVNGVSSTAGLNAQNPAILALDRTSSTRGAAIFAGRRCGTSSSANIMVLATNSDPSRFRFDCNGQFFADNGTVGTPGDYAEYFPTDDVTLTAGDVVALTSTSASSVRRAMSDMRAGVIGVVSAHPLVTGNAGVDGSRANDPHFKIIGLLGQLPVNVTNANGPIAAGDLIMAGENGTAVKASGVGIVIGRALESLNGAQGAVMTYVNPQWSADGVLDADSQGTRLQPRLSADSENQTIDSQRLTFAGSVWNSASGSAMASTFSLHTDIQSVTSSLFTVSGSAGSPLLTISELGNVNIAKDLSVNGRLFLGLRSGRASTSTYIFVDDAESPTSTYISTTANGWQTESTYDYAERYQSNDRLQPGDLVTADPTGVDRVKRTHSTQDVILGIVSTRPGFITGHAAKGTYPIALAGRVPTRVSTANGAINIGDQLAPSDVSGVAVKAKASGPIVGVALESYSGSGEGLISVFVQPGWKGGEIVAQGPAPTAVVYQAEEYKVGVSPRSGLAKIYSGSSEVTVSFASLNSYPLVTVTPYGQTNKGWWLKNVTDHGFTVVLGEPPSFDLVLAWKAEPSKTGNTMSFSDGTNAIYDPTSGIPAPVAATSTEITTSISTIEQEVSTTTPSTQVMDISASDVTSTVVEPVASSTTQTSASSTFVGG